MTDMKRTLLFIAFVLTSLTMSAQGDLTVGDIQNSGCLNKTQEEKIPTIVLTKEGSVLSVQLLNYESYTATTDFNVTSSISNDDPCSVTISVTPVIPEGAQVDWEERVCPFNVSFTIRDFEPNRFYLDCWWYKGLVELTEGEPMVMEYNDPELLYGEWWLVGWNDGGIIFEVDTNYVSRQHLSIEIPREGYVKAYSMVNEIYVGLLTLNGNEMIFGGEMRGGSTLVYGSMMENLFFEEHICDIKSYQLEGKRLKLYYTDNDYFIFTKDFDDNPELYYEWKNGPADPYIGEVTAINDDEVEVKILHSPSYVASYSRTMPPVGNHEPCHFSKSDLAGLSFEVGDKVAFRIVQFKRLKTDIGREYQLKVEPYKSSEYVTNRTGTMHNDRRMGWIIIDDEVNESQGGIYYYPMKVLPETYLVEGQPVTFSGEIFPTWKTPWDNKGHSDCYYLSIDVFDDYRTQHEYRPFVEDDKVWIVRVIPSWAIPDMEQTERYFEYYYFDGDTIINEQTAKRMLYDRIGSNWDTIGEYIGAWYEQDKKVYYAGKGKQQFELLYDFTLSTGDIIQSEDLVLQVTKMSGGIPGFKGTYYDLQYINYTPIVERWLEGVGSEYYPWLNLRERWAGAAVALLVCKAGDEIIYYNSEEEDPFSMGAKKHRFDFTHTIKTKPKARTREDNAETLYGEYNNQLLDIRLNPLDATYLVRITNESDQVVYEKTINAGSIVGLNIDISAFAKGRYTVTIENSGESFTGEFETITTGIQELINKEDTKNFNSSTLQFFNSIYNLQGQRLNTLQKGLNIVNGRKVLVK